MYYKGGTYNGVNTPGMCGNTENDLDHAVLLVGYGTDA